VSLSGREGGGEEKWSGVNKVGRADRDERSGAEPSRGTWRESSVNLSRRTKLPSFRADRLKWSGIDRLSKCWPGGRHVAFALPSSLKSPPSKQSKSLPVTPKPQNDPPSLNPSRLPGYAEVQVGRVKRPSRQRGQRESDPSPLSLSLSLVRLFGLIFSLQPHLTVLLVIESIRAGRSSVVSFAMRRRWLLRFIFSAHWQH